MYVENALRTILVVRKTHKHVLTTRTCFEQRHLVVGGQLEEVRHEARPRDERVHLLLHRLTVHQYRVLLKGQG